VICQEEQLKQQSKTNDTEVCTSLSSLHCITDSYGTMLNNMMASTLAFIDVVCYNFTTKRGSWYWHQRAGVEVVLSVPSGVWFTAVCSLQRFNTIGWVTRGSSCPLEKPVSHTLKGTLPEFYGGRKPGNWLTLVHLEIIR